MPEAVDRHSSIAKEPILMKQWSDVSTGDIMDYYPRTIAGLAAKEWETLDSKGFGDRLAGRYMLLESAKDDVEATYLQLLVKEMEYWLSGLTPAQERQNLQDIRSCTGALPESTPPARPREGGGSDAFLTSAILPEDFTPDTSLIEDAPSKMRWDTLVMREKDGPDKNRTLATIPQTLAGLVELEWRVVSSEGFRRLYEERCEVARRSKHPTDAARSRLLSDLMYQKLANSSKLVEGDIEQLKAAFEEAAKQPPRVLLADPYRGQSEDSGDDGEGDNTKRVNINQAPRTTTAVEYLRKTLGWTQTDALNRGAQLIADAVRAQEAGGGVLFQDAPDAAAVRVRIY